jgi:SAM-dependent methyltransferase
MEHVTAYRFWQAPFAEKKFAPVLRHNDISSVHRVLDVGCGPGTNTHHFGRAAYLGLDINQDYIAYARRRYGRDFLATDIRKYVCSPSHRFDFILVNSFFHHLDDDDTRRILVHLSSLLTTGGSVHILDLVMPAEPSIARFLARSDRGEFPRPLGDWCTLFGESFEPVVFEAYPLGALGVTLWQMVYFKGKHKA